MYRTNALDQGKERDLSGAGCCFVTKSPIHLSSLSLLPFQYLPKDLMEPPECLLQSTHPQRGLYDFCVSENTLCCLSISLPNFFSFASKRPQAIFGATVCFPLHYASRMRNSQDCCRSVTSSFLEAFIFTARGSSESSGSRDVISFKPPGCILS